jgi:DNA polymerase-1
MLAAGAPKMPGWSAYDKLKSAKKAIGTIAEYERAASTDGRIHSIITCSTATGRMKSSDPNLQNVPREDCWRALVNAEPDHVNASIDYSAVEMRLATGLAEVAIADIRARVARHDTESWFMRMVLVGYHATHRLVAPPEPEGKWTPDWLQEAIPAVAQTVLGRKQQAMATIFHRDLEPHMSTALIMAHQAGLLDTGGMSVLDWLATHDEKEVEVLKAKWKAWRQKAKAINFGLLYGMSAATLHERGITDYNLTWTLEEATKVRNDWFKLYPEIRLWHFWIKYIASIKLDQGTVMVWDTYHHDDDEADDDEDERERTGKLKWPEHGARIYYPTTLVGRPFAILDGFKEARNYPDQGSGADILVRAIAMLPDKIAKMLRLPCHDELLFEIPADEVDEVLPIIKGIMVQAGDQVLRHLIPVKVEVQVGPTWAKPARIPSPRL